MPAGDLGVALREAAEQDIHVAAPAERLERPLDQYLRTVADHAAHGGQRGRGEPGLGQHLRQHGVDVGCGLDQGAVEIEHHGAGIISQGHTAPG